ncbi:MAG: type II secretion system protein [Candidatus Vogelbacteria bacterium]|nr:type II secretion system protein [Candidatus Vogelbacteria bacterium]
MFKKITNKKGFTLIELLVVIAIIGILSSVVLVSLQSSRAKARDAKRIADVGSIQQALALYYDSNNQYPANFGALVSAGLLPAVPVGPNVGETYHYVPSSDNLSYHLGASLEQVSAGTGVLGSDKDCTSVVGGTPLCNGFSAGVSGGFSGADTAKCDGTSGGACYDVTP